MMRDLMILRLLLNLKLRDWLGTLIGMTTGQILRLFVSLFLAALIAALVYRFDLFIFSYLMGAPDLGKLVIARFFELAFLFFFLMLIISTALTALSMLYRRDELNWLFSLPLSEGAIFTAKYLEVILYSSWALVALTVPFILSYGVYFNVNWVIYFSLFGGLLLPLVLISGSLGVAAAVMMRWLFGGIPRRTLFRFSAITIALVVIVFLIVIFVRPGASQRGLSYLFTFLDAKRAEEGSLIPHKLIAQGFFSLLEERYATLERVMLTLLGLCALIVLLTLDMGKVLYYRSFLAGADQSHTRGRSFSLFRKTPKQINAWISPIYRALLRKDLLDFRRSPLQWGQALLLLGFWTLYLANILNLHRFFDLNSPFWKILLFYANFCFACYFTAALAGRFIFPLISLEGRAFWILKSAPLAMESLLWSKFWQAFLPLLFFGGSLILMGNLALGLPAGLIQVSLLAMVVVCISLTSLALGLGAIFADFSQANPMKIANTPGGILCIFSSLVFMVLVTSIFGWPTYLFYKFITFNAVFPLTEWTSTTIIIIALGIVVTYFPLRLGLRALNADPRI